MTFDPRYRRYAAWTAVSLGLGLIINLWPQSTPAVVAPAGDSVAFAEKRLAKLREDAATAPAREEILKKVQAELATREKGILNAETAAQAQAQLIEIVRDLGRAETPAVEIRSTELIPIEPLGDAYGEAAVAVQINCRIDQLLNIMAGIGARPELISTGGVRITAGNAKDKTLEVRLTVSGVVPRRLVPARHS